MHRTRLVVIAIAAMLATFVACPACAAKDAIFSTGLAVSDDLALFPQWSRLVVKMREPERNATRPVSRRVRPAAGVSPVEDCDEACGQQLWGKFLAGLRTKPWLQKIEAVNRWANAKPYIEDWMNWGVSDYWEAPEEFIRRDGDCEDYAIAKYFSLIRLGYPSADLRIVIVHDRNLDASHALVAVRHAGRTWLLDIGVDDPIPLEDARQYTPVYGLAQGEWWLYPPILMARQGKDHS